MKESSCLEQLHIRPATVTDLEMIEAIESESFTEPWSRSMFEAELEGNQFAHVYSAWLPQGETASPHLCGYVCFWVVFEELRLMNLAVIQGCRRQGLGKALVRFALDFGQSRGAMRALLEVRSSNGPARKMYEYFGFQHYGVRKLYYTKPEEDAILMRLEPIGGFERNDSDGKAVAVQPAP